MSKITRSGPNLVVDGVKFNLTEHVGKKVTVFREDDGTLTMESKPVHQTTVCELIVPKVVINSEETGETDEMGTPVMKEVIAALDLSKTVVHKFKEVA